MKKFIYLLLALFVFLGLTACDGEKQPLDVKIGRASCRERV